MRGSYLLTFDKYHAYGAQMNSLSRKSALLAILAALLVGLNVLAAPHATGLVSRTFDVNFHTKYGGGSLNGNLGGRAEVSLRLEFLTKRKIGLDLWHLSDRCNAAGTNDGYGAFLKMGIYMESKERDQVALESVWLADYTKKCGGFKRGYDIRWKLDSTKWDRSWVITGAIFTLYECSRRAPHVCSRLAVDQANSRRINSPEA